MKLLIVDDSRTMRNILRRQLEAFGLSEILQASDGFEALDLLEQNQDTEVMLLDWNLPNIDGLEVVKRIRQQMKFTKLRIIVCSSDSNLERKQELIKAGAENYITKPFVPEELKSVLGI